MYFYIVILGVLALDLLTKSWAQAYISERLYLISDFVYLGLYKNTGIAFSFPIEGIILKCITIILIGGIFWYYLTQETKELQKQILYGSIVGGALGNGYERIFYGEVTDFIGIKYFAVFNVADTALSVGVFILIISIYAKGCTSTKGN